MLAAVALRDGAHLLGRLYGLTAEEKPRFALSMLFDVIDRWMLDGQWSRVEAVLAEADPSRLAPVCVSGLLTITRPARDRLAGRPAYADRARRHLEAVLPTERVERILRGAI